MDEMCAGREPRTSGEQASASVVDRRQGHTDETALCAQTAADRSLDVRILTTIPLHPTGLETRTKESNMCASLRGIETRGHNESKDRPHG